MGSISSACDLSLSFSLSPSLPLSCLNKLISSGWCYCCGELCCSIIKMVWRTFRSTRFCTFVGGEFFCLLSFVALFLLLLLHILHAVKWNWGFSESSFEVTPPSASGSSGVPAMMTMIDLAVCLALKLQVSKTYGIQHTSPLSPLSHMHTHTPMRPHTHLCTHTQVHTRAQRNLGILPTAC